MKILTLDAASAVLFCALVIRKDAIEQNDDAVQKDRAVEQHIHCIEHQGTEHHSATVAPSIAQLIDKYGEPDLIVCGSGPGSFSGLRIALASTKGLALALDIPFVLVATLEAWAVNQEKTTLVLLDARSQRFYAQFYRQGRALSPVRDAHSTALEKELTCLAPPYRLCGPAAPLFLSQTQLSMPYELEKAAAVPFASRLANLGYQRWQREGGASAMATPSYLRAAISQPLKLVKNSH